MIFYLKALCPPHAAVRSINILQRSFRAGFGMRNINKAA